MTETLSTVCEEIVDCVNRTAPEALDGEYLLVGTPAMRGNLINESQARRVSKATFQTWTRRLAPRAGDLLLAREAPVGPVVRIPDGGRVGAGQRTTHLRANAAKVDSRFLYYLLVAPATQERLIGQAMGSTVAHLRVADLKSFALPPLPPLNEQQAIAEVLGALDDKIAANTALARTAEQVLRAEIDGAWLMRPGRDAALDDFVELNPRTSAPPVDEPVYVDMKRLPEHGWSIDGYDRRPAKGGARFQVGDTLLARITPCLENRKTGFVDHLPAGEVGLGSTEFIVLRSRPGIAAPISFLLATEPRFREHAIQHMVGTSGRQRVAATDLARFNLPTPDQVWLTNFGHRSEAIFASVAALSGENRTLVATRDALLPQLMSGKLRIRDAEAIAAEAGI